MDVMRPIVIITIIISIRMRYLRSSPLVEPLSFDL